MKFRKKDILVIGLAVMMAVTMLIGGGTFAYLKGETQDVKNEFNVNKVMVDLTETTQDYQIVPGTSQKKDPTVTVNATIPAYVYVIVDDETAGLVGYEIDERWAVLGDEYPGVYWREVQGSEEPQTIPVLKDNMVSYDKALENSDMLDENGQLKKGITLTFQAKAIQKEPFGNPIDAYEEKVQVKSTLAVAFGYEGNEANFVGESVKTDDSLLIQAAGLKYGPGKSWYNNNKYTFSIKGSANKDMTLSYDFAEKCGANETYKGQTFPGGFGGFGDTYALAGDYHDWETDSAGTKEDDFTLVGDYYPVVVTVTHTKGSAVDFNFTGSLTELVKELSESVYTLKAGTEYDEEFEITVLWPLETACTEDCYVVKGNQKPDIMDKADNIFGCTENLDTVGYDLWADFEVTIKEAN